MQTNTGIQDSKGVRQSGTQVKVDIYYTLFLYSMNYFVVLLLVCKYHEVELI